MKPFAFVLFAFCFYWATHLQAADPWKEQPILHAIGLSANTAMGEYELWAEDWKKGKRGPTSADQSMNLMTEATLIPVQMALAEHPHPQFLEQCLLFLGTTVLPEFDDLWRARILEMADLDKTVTKKVDALLKARNLPSLGERATGDKKTSQGK